MFKKSEQEIAEQIESDYSRLYKTYEIYNDVYNINLYICNIIICLYSKIDLSMHGQRYSRARTLLHLIKCRQYIL